MATSVYQQGGYGTAPLFPNPVLASRDPTTTDKVDPSGQPYQVFQGWNNVLTDACFLYLGSGNWVTIASVVGSVAQLTGNSGVALPAAGNINVVGSGALAFTGAGSTLTGAITPGTALLATLTGDSGGARSPTAGNMNILGTANQITTTGAGSNITLSLPAAITAPGSLTTTTSLSATTTVTAGTGITATTGDITATAGNIVASAGNISATAGSVSAGTSITAGTTLTATLGAITATNGNLVLGTAGNKLQIATGANASVGTATLAGGTVTVNTTAVTASSIILLTRQSIGATGAAATGNLTVGTVTPATSFVINAVQAADATALQASDVSVVGWVIIN